jgi:dipeptidyl aminopeptidase/acylaminoacyl peptidase
MRRAPLRVVLGLLIAITVAGIAAPDGLAAKHDVETYRFSYRAHDGARRYALLLLPGWYGPRRHPSIPLVICPHGRNTRPEAAAKRWFDLPTRGGFAVVLPEGQGRTLTLDSWGYPGQIADLARMPRLAAHAVPFFHYRHVYAVGASMGAQETLLLLAKYPRLLAGAIAFDPALNMANRYFEFSDIRFGRQDRANARREIGGTPAQVPDAYRVRSPATYVRRIARSGVPLELWWSTKDQVIVNQASQASHFFDAIVRLHPSAPVRRYVGSWPHTLEDSAFQLLPIALARIGLLPTRWLSRDPLASAHALTANDGRVRAAVPRPRATTT